ncbi:hypothetical protein GCM10027176_35590 [Actinoallomurus bryophytorum]|uniref:DUF1877 family protein n=1 Tax=Actinoallomurus bryophytorum TaxID=1490222 RepID=A0A543CIH3_9ACTN|nr:hypothetical protein [Actinoallomurus bryophytorum]TQL96895.1 hypothetical protein FB559_2448 [Actinoallomurus bryophytorum]
MSIIIKFFVAPDDTSAAAIVDRGPTGLFESLDAGNFDAAEAVIEWEGIFTGRSFEALVSAGEPRMVADPGEDGGPVVFAASGALRGALAGAAPARLAEVGELWIQERAEEGEVFDPEMVGDLLGELANLARTAAGRGHSLYCWMA